MKNYRLVIRKVDRHVFDEIADGRKSIETRAATDKYKHVSTGDLLTFTCEGELLTKTVTSVDHYKSIDDMYKLIPVSKVLPSASNVDEAKRIHFSFPGYKEKLEAFGVMAFGLM